MIEKLCMMHCVYVCVLFVVPTDIQKSNNVKLVQSSVPSDSTKVTLLLWLSPLNVVTVVVDMRQFQPTAWVCS